MLERQNTTEEQYPCIDSINIHEGFFLNHTLKEMVYIFEAILGSDASQFVAYGH